MSQEFQQHWLSAYLDDELSSDERALVERRLEEDAEARALLEDLKRVRGLVAGLPDWGDQGFQFDMSRLHQSLPEQDEPGSAETQVERLPLLSDATSTSDSPALPTEPASSTNAVAPRSTVKAGGAGVDGFSLPSSAWRGILALAAGLIVMLLCWPYFWRTDQTTVAIQTERPGSQASGEIMGGLGGVGGGVGGGSEINDEFMFGSRSNVAELPGEPRSEPTLDHAQNLPAAPARGAPMAAVPLPAAPMPAMPDPTALADAPGDAKSMKKYVEGDMATPAPATKPAAADKNSEQMFRGGVGGGAARGSARGGGESLLEAHLAESNQLTDPMPKANAQSRRLDENAKGKATDENKAKSLALNVSSAELLLARSTAWSESEVAQALPQLRSMLPTPAGASTAKEQAASAVAGESTVEQTKNDWLVTELPNSTDVSNWFSLVQTAQPLVQIPLANVVPAKDSESNNVGRQSGEAESIAGAKPPAGLDAAKQKVKPDEGRKIADGGRILLFVTESEAKKILATLPGDRASRFWRVVPSDSGKLVEKISTADEKVIVILNRTP